MHNNKIIEVVYALPAMQYIFLVELTDTNSITILEAIKRSGILEYYPEIDLNLNKVGIYGEIKQLSDLAGPNDRIEIYRPLLIEPMEARRLKAVKQKAKDSINKK